MEFRQAKPSELKEIVALSDSVFRKAGQHSMGDSFTQLFSEQNAEHLWIAKDEAQDQIVGLIGLYPSVMSLAGCEVPVFSLGSVCTNPAYRGQGIASKLLALAYQHIEQRGGTVLLVSGRKPMYMNQGCLPVGRAYKVTLDRSLLTEKQKSEAAVGAETVEWDGAVEPLHRLQEQELVFFRRTPEMFEELIQGNSLLSCMNMENQVWLHSRNGAADAYVVMGIDLREGKRAGRVLEFAGSDEGLEQMLRHLIERLELDSISLIINDFRYPLAESLVHAGGKLVSDRISGTLRVMDIGRLWKHLEPYMERVLGKEAAEQLKCESYQDGYRIRLGEETYILDGNGWTELVFNGPSYMKQGLLGKALKEIFPLPFDNPANLNFI